MAMELVRNEAKNAEFEKRARELVAQMTLEEKAFQMMHGAPAIERLGMRRFTVWRERESPPFFLRPSVWQQPLMRTLLRRWQMPFPRKAEPSLMSSRNLMIRISIRD